MTTNKTYYARVYAPTVSGTTTSGLLSQLKDVDFQGFSWGINEGLGECQIRLPRKVDDYNTNNDIGLFNQFEVYVNDKESESTGDLIYSGYIVDYSEVIDGSKEWVDVTLWGYASEFATKMLETTSGTQVAYFQRDPSDILVDVFNRYDGKIALQSVPGITENFTTTTYQDTNLNTARWDTANDQLTMYFNGGVDTLGGTGDAIIMDPSTALSVVMFGWTPSGPGTLTEVKLSAKIDSLSASGGVAVNLYTQNGVHPGTFVGTIGTINASALTTSHAVQTLACSLAVTRQPYYIVLDAATIDPLRTVTFQGNATPSGTGTLYRVDPNNPFTNNFSTISNANLKYTFTYTSSGELGVSLGYDSGITSPTYLNYQATATTPAGSSLTYEFSDSADNITFGAWTSSFSSLTQRYFRFRITLTATSSLPTVSQLVFNISGNGVNRTGTTVSYVFNQNTIKDALDKVLELSPAYWYWRVGPENRLYFAQRNTSVIDHYLTIGKDVAQSKITYSGKDLRNAFYLLGANGNYFKSVRTSSQSQFGTRVDRRQDEGVTDSTTGGLIATSFLDLYDHTLIFGTITVADSNGDDGGYDIESILPGQVIVVQDPARQNIVTNWDVASWDVDFWDFPLTTWVGVPFQVVRKNYMLDKCVLEIAYQSPDATKVIDQIKRNLVKFRTATSPANPTVV